MSCSNKPVFFNDQKQYPRNAVVKNGKNDKLKEITRCCICFENYSLNTRAPICVPCGHSFCAVCIRKLIYGNLVCCCICRNVAFFGPKELGKNIQLLDILESLGLLDPDETKQYPLSSPSIFPENVIDAINDKDVINFFDFCFRFVKKFYENKQETMITNIAMATEDGSQEHIVRSAERMFFARGRLSDSFDTALLRFNECLQTMNSLNTDPVPQIFPAYGGIDEFVPVIDDDINDPFGIESVSFRAFIFTDANENQDFVNAFEEHDSTQNYPVSDSSDYADDQHYNNNPANDNDQRYNNPANDDQRYNNPANDDQRYNNPANDDQRYNNPANDDQRYNNPANDDQRYNNPALEDDYHFNNSDNVDYHNVPTYDEEYDDFRPGVWAPLSQLFSLSRVNHPN